MQSSADTKIVETVVTVLARILVLDNHQSSVGRSTELIGSLPGFDSHSVVAVMLELEEEFGIEFEDDEVSAELFASVGTLADFVASKIAD